MNNWSGELQGIIVTFCFNQFPSGVGESALKGKRQWQRMRKKERAVGDGNGHWVFSHCTDICWGKRPDSFKHKMTFLYMSPCRFSVNLLLHYWEVTCFTHSQYIHMYWLVHINDFFCAFSLALLFLKMLTKPNWMSDVFLAKPEFLFQSAWLVYCQLQSVRALGQVSQCGGTKHHASLSWPRWCGVDRAWGVRQTKRSSAQHHLNFCIAFDLRSMFFFFPKD